MNRLDEHGGPAFPFTPSDPREPGLPGMTLRDYFAARAMQGWLSTWGPDGALPKPNRLAVFAYEVADAMLQAREGA